MTLSNGEIIAIVSVIVALVGYLARGTDKRVSLDRRVTVVETELKGLSQMISERMKEQNDLLRKLINKRSNDDGRSDRA